MSVNSDLLLTDSDVQIQKSNLHSTRGITPKRVASREAHLRCLDLGNTALKKRRSGGKPLRTLCPI